MQHSSHTIYENLTKNSQKSQNQYKHNNYYYWQGHENRTKHLTKPS